MEHEVFVPVPAEVLRATLRDPARVVRCVPGLQRDAGAAAAPAEGAAQEEGALTGRLKVRVGGHTITYRGALRIVERDDAITYEGQGAEARGKGTAELSLTVVLTPVAEGTRLTFTGALTAGGRLAEVTEEDRAAAGAKLLGRFVAGLETAAAEQDAAGRPSDGTAAEGRGAGADARADAGAGADADSTSVDGTDSDAVVAFDSAADENDDGIDDGIDDGAEEPRRGSVFDAPVPPPSLDPVLGGDFGDTPIEFPAPQPAAEAAHARRTMIGRSAEEVDHAPPRGRYAPVPAPQASSAGATLRWVAPAAALALASAVVVGRALRRRR
ncbi:SRPBCC family protein [Streptomyces sp. NPDC014891]|uniref:SRPBCC family protein n=1 Tax=Streptomyces sp. NPDC014891 TaxID=3364929 RepID=UPI0037018B9D